VLLVLLLGLLAGATPADEPPPRPVFRTEADWAAAVAKLTPGMPAAEVEKALGPPRRRARQLLYQRYLEQWLYDEPGLLRLEFDYRRGQPQPVFLRRSPDPSPTRTSG
jgi:hypothetical protein